MTTATNIVSLPGHGSRRDGKRDGKKRQLAKHTLKTLAQLGYARTSLRDIAEQSDVSVGILHYYFEDKSDLISYCVQLYKDDFVGRLDAVLSMEGSHRTIIQGFCDGLVNGVETDAETHRLWYDIRAQALFDERFNPIVSELEQAMIALCGRMLMRVGLIGYSPLDVYLTFDGLFRYYLQRRLASDKSAVDEFSVALRASVDSLAVL